jgi:hypothetical protein
MGSMSPLVRACFALALSLWTVGAAAAIAPRETTPREAAARADAASQLKARYAQVKERLERSPYGRPLMLDSRELARELQGDAYAVVPQPFPKVEAALAPVGNWCEVLMLPFNTKHCAASTEQGATRLALFVGRKNDTPVRDAYRLDFDYEVIARGPDFLQIELRAGQGPLGTRNYRIVMELTPIDDRRSFLHLYYSYGYGMASKVAMQAYLATLGASKVGFTSDSNDGDLVRGMRGVMERNTMRYYLALDAYLASLDAPAGAAVTKRLNDWFSATERYPRQLNENIDRAQYVSMKQREYARMAGVTTASGS